MRLGENEKYVDSIHLYNSGVPGLRINMVCAGDYFAIDILQNYKSESIIHTLLKKLDSVGLIYSVSECIPFETIKDKAHITASRQAERYYKKEH